MKLTLHYHPNPDTRFEAAFIRGKSVRTWLKTIEKWHIPMETMHFFVIPESIKASQPAGIFVIFKENMPSKEVVQYPYQKIGKKLFIPNESQLFPEMLSDELDTMIYWDFEVYHPSIGMIGFEDKDEVQLIDFLEITESSSKNNSTFWGQAAKGVEPFPVLTHIQVAQPATPDVMERFKDEVGTKPLKDIIPKDEKKSKAIFNKVNKNINNALTKIGFGAAKAIYDRLPVSKNPNQGPTFFDKMMQYFAQKMNNLENERDNEIERLLKLFESDEDEALRYALPLDTPASRGTEENPSGSLLNRKNLQLNVNQLGGNGKIDHWTLKDQHYQNLRAKYQNAANKQIEEKNFTKAAYIYAHLLSDFQAAAGVLVKGKYFREAASIYKKQLQDLPKAAICLENGGLLLEAIDAYKELKKDEKVGDLYEKLAQPQNAQIYYQNCIDNALKNKDYLEAARLLEQKIKDEQNAKNILLEGWEESVVGEICLQNYLLLTEKNEKNNLSEEVKYIFEHKTQKNQYNSFLNVLAKKYKENDTPEFQKESTKIAYQIVSEGIRNGDNELLYKLKQFLPDDPIVSSDVAKYVIQNKKSNKKAKLHIQLDPTIEWLDGMSLLNQFVMIGIKGKTLYFARGNWSGKVEYHTHSAEISHTFSGFVIEKDLYTLNKILLKHKNTTTLYDEKILPANNIFPENLIIAHSILKPQQISVITGVEASVYLEFDKKKTTLKMFRSNAPTYTTDCKLTNENDILLVLNEDCYISDLTIRNHLHYVANDTYIYEIKQDGSTQKYDFKEEIIGSWVSEPYSLLRFVLITAQNKLIIFHPAPKTSLEPIVKHTLEHQNIRWVKLFPDNKLVLASLDEVSIYSIHKNDKVIQQPFSIKAHSPIVNIFRTDQRDTLAVLQENGNLQMYVI